MSATLSADKEHQRLLVEFDAVISRCTSQDNNLKPTLVIAYSGGLDSHMLLLVAAHWVRQNSTATIRAVYIDHGLQKESVAWSQHCEKTCAELAIPFQSYRVEVDHGSGASPENAARKARYHGLSQTLATGDYLLTAHHADDQAETLLLQLLRGAGVRGLSSMPERRALGSGYHLRPFLSVARESLLSCAMALELEWIEDPSNDENKFDRNLLRNTVMPLLRKRWPAMATSISRSARHCADSADLNRLLAFEDLGAAVESSQLSLNGLTRLNPSRRKNAIRVWVEHHRFQPPSTAQLERINMDLVLASAESAGVVSFGQAQIRRYAADLYLAERSFFADVQAFNYDWKNIEEPLFINETGQTLTVDELSLPWLERGSSLQVRSRQGGERIRLNGHKNSKSVKALLQQNGIPPWQRDRLPFLYLNENLVGVVGVGFSARP